MGWKGNGWDCGGGRPSFPMPGLTQKPLARAAARDPGLCERGAQPAASLRRDRRWHCRRRLPCFWSQASAVSGTLEDKAGRAAAFDTSRRGQVQPSRKGLAPGRSGGGRVRARETLPGGSPNYYKNGGGPEISPSPSGGVKNYCFGTVLPINQRARETGSIRPHQP